MAFAKIEHFSLTILTDEIQFSFHCAGNIQPLLYGL